MRLYNAESCTPMGSTSIYVAPKGTSPRKDLPQSPTAFSRRWKLQKDQRNTVADNNDTLDSPARMTKITSAFFDPFEIETSVEFPVGAFDKVIGSRSSATSVTEKLTPAVSTEPHDFFAASSDDDGFPIMDRFDTHQVDFQSPTKGDLFNDASTWMTSSTLSTKFTNREVQGITTMPKQHPLGVAYQVGASHPFRTATGAHSRSDSFGRRPVEVVVSKTPSHSLSEAKKEPLSEAFDPFSCVISTPVHQDQHETDKENRPTYAAAKAKLRSVPKKALPSLPSREEPSSIPIKLDKKLSTRPTQHTSKPLHASEMPAKTGATERRQVRAQLDSLLSTRFHNGHVNSGPHVNTSKKDEPSKEPCSEESEGVVLSPSNSRPKASPAVANLISSAALASGAARLRNTSTTVGPRESKANLVGGPGSFLAERVEAKRPEAVFQGRMDSVLPSIPSDAATKQSSPVDKMSGLTGGNALQNMLNARLGEKDGAKNSGTNVDASNKKTTETAQQGSEGVPLKDDPAYAKYFKMLKMGLPLGAVKNAMERDGMDPSVLDGDHSKASRTKSEGVPLKDDPAYAKYFKMLKMGLPLGAVKNAMGRDGLDPSVLDGDHSKPTPTKVEGVPLKDDPRFAKYTKMLKMGLPMGAVKNAMERDGLDSSVLDGDLSAPAGGEKAKTGAVTKKAPKDKFRRTRVHWETHRTVRSNTVWAMLSRDPDVTSLKVDEDEFRCLFQAELKPAAVQQSAQSTGATEKGAVKVIDKKRANNGGITLARIKLSYEEVANAVDSYDDSALTQEQIRGILQYLPTTEEKTSLRSYLEGESVDDLCECEKFMVSIMMVKHAKRKLNAILYMQKFDSALAELLREARLVQKACDEIMGSSRLRKVLGIVLNIGNRLNTAGPTLKEPAEAVTLESLLKLTQPKAFDKKTTFLQYVANVVRQNYASLCHFKDDLTAVFIAEKILWESSLAELERMETELESVRRLALYHALEREHSNVSSRGSVSGDSVAAMSIPSKLSVKEEINLLGKTSIGKFTLDACAEMEAVVNEVNAAKTSYDALLRYFGEEDNSTTQPNEVFHIISTFSKDFEASLSTVVETEKAQQRREVKRQSRKRAPKPLASVSDASEGSSSNRSMRKRLSSGMSGILNDLRKPHLKWRRRKHVP